MQSASVYTPQAPLRGLIIVKDSLEANGAFLVPYSLHAALQQGLQVVLVALVNSMSHYQYVLRKLGTNLQACRDAQKVCVMEELPADGTAAHDAPADPYNELAGRIECKIQDLQRGREHAETLGTCLIFDSFSALRCLHDDDHHWRRFVHRWSQPAVIRGTQEPLAISCLLAVVHGDVDDDGLWIRYLEHAAQMVIAVDALEMGQSLDITGQVKVTQRAACSLPGGGHAPCNSGGTSRLLNYKLQDNGVRFMECRASVSDHHMR